MAVGLVAALPAAASNHVDTSGPSKIVIKVQTFPMDRAVEAYRISQRGHLRGKLVLLP